MKLIHFIKNQANWIDWKHPWLIKGEVPADNLKDLTIQNNELSTFYVENDDVLYRVAAAFACQRKIVRRLDYIKFELEQVKSLGIKSDLTPGETDDQLVNTLHVNISELSAEKCVSFIHMILDSGSNGRILEEKLVTEIAISISKRQIIFNETPKEIKNALIKWGKNVQ